MSARVAKQVQLEREIRNSSATATQKANMLHTLSKLCIFAGEESDRIDRYRSRIRKLCLEIDTLEAQVAQRKAANPERGAPEQKGGW